MTTLHRGMTAEEFIVWMDTVPKLKSLTDVGMRDGVDGDLCIDQVGAAAKACPESLVHLFHEGSSTGARAKLAQLVGVGRLDREVNHPTAAPAVPWASFGPFCGALRDILRIYGFEGDARAQGEVFTRIYESTSRRLAHSLTARWSRSEWSWDVSFATLFTHHAK